MSRFSFEPAKPADDPALGALLRQSAMPGAIQIAFEREPSFLRAQCVEGDFHETLVCRDRSNDQIVGMGCRSVRTAFINGVPRRVGYLSGLRLAPKARRAHLLARGFQALRDRMDDGRADVYLTTIVEENPAARSLLTSGRCALPQYHHLGSFRSFALNLKHSRARPVGERLTIRSAHQEDLPFLVKFLQTEGAKKEFFPCYSAEDFQGKRPLLKGLPLSNVFLGFSGTQLRGVLAAWDQRAMRQIRVLGYDRKTQLLRKPWNLFARMTGAPLLPPAGTCLNALHLAMVCVADNDAAIFDTMLEAVIVRLRDSHDLVLGGFHERDPLLTVLKRRPHVAYGSGIYMVSWPGAEHASPCIDPMRIPYLEIATL